MLRIASTFALSSILLCLSAAPGLAAPSVASATAPASDPAALAGQIQAKRARATKLRASMGSMRVVLAGKMAKHERVSAQLDRNREQSAATSARLAQIDGVLAHSRIQLDELAVRAYRSDGLDWLSALLGTTSFSDFVTRVDFLGMIGKNDARIIAQVQGARAESQRLQDTLKEQEVQLVGLRDRVDAQRSQLQAEIVAQQTTLHSLGADIARLVKEQEQAQAAAAMARGKGLSDAALTQAAATGGREWLLAPSLTPGASASLESRPGADYLVPGGQATAYRSTGIAWGGVASWYGNAENGTATSSGRPYNENELTCAHKTLPFGTLLAVSRGNKHAIVVVTDHGPYVPGRDIDLSKAAAQALGFDGVEAVHAEIVVPSGR